MQVQSPVYFGYPGYIPPGYNGYGGSACGGCGLNGYGNYPNGYGK